ncbi:peptidylprolyl isomerase PrsA [Streptococcus mutans]|uniref:peptidylprolyl isomerase PrsA n=1 Tax=Streptococcus mutans TaxID=1309 RepID=UPI0022E078F5|nr:peptidylprolyl isomerase PrsA [Streptococcus mutans]MDT9515696.1 peptidylprolyl isomerase PrsA [Streptococcus mutans]MDT9517799.1 peptidylprolyl isomerase PrsA [Streptococcus mutans]MDT9558354.1 peptidylprolyl isomerase PrsA [Streptococcus mutans]MDT9601450.1 peptidylprolyl isomerase PrsA [Streptococcus mutans]
MKKRTIATGLVTLLSIVTLAACSKTNQNSKIATMKGDTITVADFYNEVKNSTASKQAVLSLLVSKVFEKQYGDKVSDKEVTKAYNEAAKYYGDSFSSALASRGYTKEDYKKQIRSEKLIEYAVKEEAKKEITDASYKSAYKDYKPEVTAQVIQLDSEDKAKSVLEEAKADGADFAKIAKDNTKGDKTEYSFDSGSTNLPSQVLSAALNLDKDGVSDVIKASDSTTYKPVYYIVKITKKIDKNADWKAYKKRLKEIIVSQKLNDSNFRNAVIGKAFKKANVKIKDKAFSEILSQYAAASGSGSSGSTTTTTAASSAATTAADDQTTAAETTAAETTAAE